MVTFISKEVFVAVPKQILVEYRYTLIHTWLVLDLIKMKKVASDRKTSIQLVPVLI